MADVPDAIGLTQKEKNLVRNTWAILKKDVKDTGYDLFIKFFTENPSYQQHFKSFKDVPISEIRGNTRVAAHATSVIYAITALVDNLDEPECLTEMLVRQGSNHFRRGIRLQNFENLGTSLVGLLKDKCGDLMDEEATAAWKKTYSIILSVIQSGLDKAEKGND